MESMTIETYFYKQDNKDRVVTRAPKQRLLHLHLVCDDKHKSINYNAHIKARANLSKNAFQLFDYLEFIPDGLVWALSSSNLYKESSLTEQTYAKAFKELIDKGYIVEKPITVTNVPVYHDAYHFYEDPELVNKNIEHIKEVSKPTPSYKTPATPKNEPCTPERTKMPWEMSDKELYSIMWH